MATQTKDKKSALEPIRFQNAGPFLLAGMRRHYDCDTRTEIPQLWHEVGPHFGKLPAQVGNIGYGVCLSTSEDKDEFDYMAAAEVSEVKQLPPNWINLKIPAQHYAVFPHKGPASNLNTIVKEIFENWLPNSGYTLASNRRDVPDFIEHYGEGYDPATGTGDIEVWLPVKY